MKIRRTISVLIGLLLIGLLAYKLYEVDMKAVPAYISSISNWPEFLRKFLSLEVINNVIFYTLFGIKVLTILLIAIGGRKALIAGVILLPIVIAEIFYTHWPTLDLLYNVFKLVGLEKFFKSLSASGYLFLTALALIVVFWLVMFIVVVANKTKTIGAKVTLLIIGATPILLHYVDVFIINDMNAYVFNQWETIAIVASFGLSLLITIMLLLSQKGKKKPPSKHIWFPAIESL